MHNQRGVYLILLECFECLPLHFLHPSSYQNFQAGRNFVYVAEGLRHLCYPRLGPNAGRVAPI